MSEFGRIMATFGPSPHANRAGEVPLRLFAVRSRGFDLDQVERVFKPPSAYVCMYVSGAALLVLPARGTPADAIQSGFSPHIEREKYRRATRRRALSGHYI